MSTIITRARIRSRTSVPTQLETVSQYRTLTNAGLRSDISYVKGIHNLKAGAIYEQTFLKENDTLGIVDPTFLPSLGCTDPITGSPTGPPCTDLAPFDLTRPGAGLSGSAGTRT